MSLAPEVCAEVCQDGSIQPDPWTSYALQTQREIQYDTPLNYVSLPGTHNSAITLVRRTHRTAHAHRTRGTHSS
jgi:hypothetical protein